MCGIVGQINLNNNSVSNHDIQNMMNAVVHRGPDNGAMYCNKNIGLGFRRLSIIDLSDNANQPMENSLGTIIIIFNGEIYNYLDLKKDLISKGYKFRTKADTEVLLNLYEEYGKDCLNKINGMFAFAIYDKRSETIFFSRDRAGKKPLYYYYNGKTLIFASEIKSILAIHSIKREINQNGLSQYISLGYVIAPDSIFKNIYKLKPGHYFELSTNKEHQPIIPKKYWEVSFIEDMNRYPKIDQWGEEFYDLFKDAVKIRMISDVPLSIFLSGGLDSSAIAVTAAEITDNPIDVFTADFDNKMMSEVDTSKQIVKKYPQMRHHILNIDVNNLLSDNKIFNNIDEPLSDSSIIPTYWMSKFIKESGFTVGLSGDGGDELLLGYHGKSNFDFYDNWYKYSNKSIRILLGNTENYFFKHFNNRLLSERIRRLSSNKTQFYWFNQSLSFFELRKVLKPEFYNYQFQITDDTHGFLNIINMYEDHDFKYRLPEGYLTKVDRASMLSSFEVRNPFLDYRIIELLSKMPRKYKLSHGKTKVLLRHVFDNKFPNKVLGQRKMGFSIPLKDLILNNLKNDILITITESIIKDSLDMQNFNLLFDKIKKSPYQHSIYTEIIWRLYVLSKFFNRWSINNI